MNFAEREKRDKQFIKRKLFFFFFFKQKYEIPRTEYKENRCQSWPGDFFDWNKFLTKDLILYPFQRDIERVTCIKYTRKAKNIAVRAVVFQIQWM